MKHMGNKIINYTTMCATEISKSHKTWLISAYYREKSEFVIHYISLGSLFAQANLKLNWRDFTTYWVREVAWMSNSCTLFIDMTNVNISFEKNDKDGNRSVCAVLSISTLKDLSSWWNHVVDPFFPLSSTSWAVRRNHNWTSFHLEI